MIDDNRGQMGPTPRLPMLIIIGFLISCVVVNEILQMGLLDAPSAVIRPMWAFVAVIAVIGLCGWVFAAVLYFDRVRGEQA